MRIYKIDLEKLRLHFKFYAGRIYYDYEKFVFIVVTFYISTSVFFLFNQQQVKMLITRLRVAVHHPQP